MISKLDHIGIAVNNIKDALGLYEGILGLKTVKTEEVADQEVRVAFLTVGDTKVELLESTTPHGPIAKFIEKKGQGIQHIAFRVDDIEAVLADLKEKGVPLIDEAPRIGAGGARIAFIHPKAAQGTLIELCQQD